jgi:hypothetical protein
VRVVLLVVLAGLVGAGCEMRTRLDVAVGADGSGHVELVVAVDEEATSREPQLLAGLDVADVEATGWEVEGPAEGPDGWTRVAFRHEFGAPEEVAGLVEEISGPEGALQGFALERDDAFAETRYRFRGEVDLSGGVSGLLEDPELSQALGADVAELVDDLVPGEESAVDEALGVRVAVRLPGEVEANVPERAGGRVVWEPDVAERQVTELSATSTLSRNDRALWLVVAVVAGAAAVLVTGLRVLRWRSRGSEGS